MDAILCDISALAYHATPPILRQAPLDEAALVQRAQIPALSRARFSTLPEICAVRENLLGPLKAVPLPIHLLSPGIVHGSTELVKWHSCADAPEPRDVVQIADGLGVLMPVAALRYLARRLDVARLVQILFELCGLYGVCPETLRSKIALESLWNFGVFPTGAGRWNAYYGAGGRPLSFPDAFCSDTVWEPCLHEDGIRSDLWRRPPLLRFDTVCDALGTPTLGHDAASKRLRRAMELVQPGSGSPWETITAMLLCLPRKMGGEGLPWPKLNRRVLVPRTHLQEPRSFVLDGCWDVGTRWPQRIVPTKASRDACELRLPILPCALEIDGAAFHQGKSAFSRDSARRTALARMGIATQPVSPAQVGNISLWDEWVDVLSYELGFERVTATPTFLRQRVRLHKALLSRHGL